MKNRIKFKGRDVHTDQWVTGDKIGNRWICEDQTVEHSYDKFADEYTVRLTEVAPETITQIIDEETDNYQELKKEFDELSAHIQWMWAAKHRAEITLQLDNDNTTFTFNREDKSEDCTPCSFKADVGNKRGIEILLDVVGFAGEFV